MDFCFGLLFWFSLALSIFGLGTFAIGVVLQIMYSGGADLIETNFLSGPSLLIFIGLIIVVVALFGCCGAAKENYCMIMSFGILMLGLFIIGLAGAVACYVKRGQLENILEDKLNSTMYDYNTNVGYKKSWDYVQHEMQCCGVSGPADWEAIGNKTIPTSCCKEVPFDNIANTFVCTEPNAFRDGCYPLLLEVFKQEAVIIGTAAAIVSALQIIVISFTCYLAGTVRRDYQTV